MQRTLRAAATVMVWFVLAACSGSGSHSATAVPGNAGGGGAVETEHQPPPTLAPTPVPFTPTATPTLEAPAPPCEAGSLGTVGERAQHATAQMSMTLHIANVGTAPCSLPNPESVEVFDAEGSVIATFAPAHLMKPAPDYVNLRPMVLAPANQLTGEGMAYVWMIWGWSSGGNGPCRELPDPNVTLVTRFASFALRTQAIVQLAPCAGTGGIVEFGIVPPGG